MFLVGRKTKKVENEGTQAQKNKQVSFQLSTKAHARLLILFIGTVAVYLQELMLNRRQNAKAQARKNARAFKELDTTLQVLGINGKQAAVESSDLLLSRKGQRAPSEASRLAQVCPIMQLMMMHFLPATILL